MSLLLDALKRAEQEKHTRQPDRPASERAPARAPAPSAAVLELQPLGGVAPAAGLRAEAAGAQAAHAAQAIFRAKAAPDGSRRRRIVWLAAGVVAIAIAGAGAYVWHELNALAPRPVVNAVRHPIPPAASAAPAAAASAAKAAPAADAPALPLPAAASAPSPVARRAADDAAPPLAARGAGPDLEALLRKAQPAASPPVELSRSDDPPPRVPPDVEAGYRALVGGDLATARAHYAKALAAEPANVDARIGLATVEARSGNVAAAAVDYRDVLDLDPRNPTALAGIAALADLSRPEATENALAGEIARHPESAALELTLGNLLAAQGRWAEAQAAFFEAQRLQPENADVAYNLAVSLDHLGQRRAAAEFYRRALQARARGAAQFDAAAASRRLAELAR